MRVALLCDSPDEGWPSMDLVGEMLGRDLSSPIDAERVTLPIRRRTPHHNLNRLWFRFGDYPLWVRRNRKRFDVFHIVDHSYAQLAHELPPERTVITCHDIEAFRSVLEPDRAQRGFLFRAMTRRILSGFRRAAHIACDSAATLADLERHHVLPADRMSVVPLGTHPACSPDPDFESDRKAAKLLSSLSGETVDILHVGSTGARKRIDVLLRVFAETRRGIPKLRLLRVGGSLTAAQTALAADLGVDKAVVTLPFLDRPTLAAVYRRAAMVLLPSETEGFGLPVTEALACGTPVLASNLPVLTEVGGAAAEYCLPGNVAAWTETLTRLLTEREEHPDRWLRRKESGIVQARQFSWARYSNKMTSVYNRLL